MKSSGRNAAIAAAASGGGALLWESTVLLALTLVFAAWSLVSWLRDAAPHDHWREYRKEKRRDY